MLGDRAKHCAFTMNKMSDLPIVDKEATIQISVDALKDIDELIKVK